ncbi:senescence-associated protein-domain-containing protein [Pyronema omphalodes]|nr:senescence-associated protein-domain-containing protein [Pyronema omphalodes]
MTLQEQVLFSFPSIALAQPHSAAAVGYLVLSKTSSCPELLRVQHTPDDTTAAHSTDCIVYREQKLQKVSPREYTLETEFGELTITFPELHHLIPQEDARIEIDNEVKKGITWEMIVRDFEKDINSWVTFEKNSYSLISSPFAGESSKGGKGDYMNAIQGPSYNGGSSSSWHDNVPYDPRDFNGSTTGYPDEKKNGGRLVLVDEDNGREIGETPMTAIDIIPGSHDPVEITFPSEQHPNDPITVRPAPPDYLRYSQDPKYASSSLVQSASFISHLIITAADVVSNAMTSSAHSYTQKSQPTSKPTTFQPSTLKNFQKVATLTSTAAALTSTAAGKVHSFARNVGATLHKDKDPATRGKPGIIHTGFIAFSAVADAAEDAAKSLLGAGSVAATKVVEHRYGPQAGGLARDVTQGVRNVGLVYIDASGVSRRAVLKGVAKGMIIGKTPDGRAVQVPTDQVGSGSDSPPRYTPSSSGYAAGYDASSSGYGGGYDGKGGYDAGYDGKGKYLGGPGDGFGDGKGKGGF